MNPDAMRFPLFIDLHGREAAVIGGGAVGLRRAEVLCRFGACVTVIAPELARELDEQLTKLLGKNDSLSINDALILCSLQFLLDKRQSERSADRLRQQFSGYMEEIKRAKDDTAAKQKENEELRREVLQLRVELQQKQGGKQAEK